MFAVPWATAGASQRVAFGVMLTASARNCRLRSRKTLMPDADRLAEINAQIAVIRDNLLELTEQAAARSGAADEDINAERIAEQEAKLASLIKQRDAL